MLSAELLVIRSVALPVSSLDEAGRLKRWRAQAWMAVFQGSLLADRPAALCLALGVLILIGNDMSHAVARTLAATGAAPAFAHP
jgi:hypothetical protein